MRGLKGATSFLTRVHVRADPGDLARGIPWLPVVGGLLGLALAGVYAAASLGLTSLLSAAITVAFGVWATGAFHEDGLADTADAFGTTRSREDMLRILRDPRLGTFGVCALALSLTLRTASLAALEPLAALAVLPAAHAMSRSGADLLLIGPAATDEGLGSSYSSLAGRSEIARALLFGVIVGTFALGPLFVPAAALVLLGGLVMKSLSMSRIGGVTGDIMGAAQQIGEVAVLVVAVAGRVWLNVPWWS